MKSISANFPPYYDAATAGDNTFVRVTKHKARSETEFSRWAVNAFNGFAKRVEPGLGSDVGNPDIILMPSVLPCLVPLESKKGKIKGNRLYTSKVRPSQIVWWHEYVLNGGVGALLVDCESDGVWVVDATFIKNWEDGYRITGGLADGAYQLNTDNFTASLEAYIENKLLG